ncbi:MAG: selenide, water dikinase SelD, partial [Gemmatimonadaceae bacterium]|nr:selenide, water dikinase SelD [Gemmatimonadaceae bacterium]
YGLAGHGWEMADRSGVRLEIESASLPLYEGALQIARAGHRTGGDPRNRAYVEGHVETRADDGFVALCMDPQTSGGLLAAVDPSAVDALVADGFVAVGRFTAGVPGVVIL